MGKFSAANAAFYGFGLIKRDPLTFLGVTLLFVAFGVVLALTFVPAYARMIEAFSTGDSDAITQASLQFWATAGPVYLLIVPVYMVALGALNRSLVFGQSQGWVLGLKLGMDEVRVVVVTIVGYILAFLPYLGCVIVGVILAGVIAAAAGANQNPAAAAALVLLVPAYIAGVVLMIWIGVRLSLAAPASVGEGRFVIFESWSMTKGRFWSLFLAYLLLLILILVAELIIVAVVVAVGGVAFSSIGSGKELDLSAFTSASLGPLVIVGSGIYGAIATFMSGAFFGVAARGYIDWKESTQASAAPAS